MQPKTALVLMVMLSLLTACETFSGFGRDTQKLGNNITDAAETVKQKVQ